MSSFGPFDVRPGVLQRSTDLLDIVTRARPGTSALRLWAADSLENSYGTLVGSGLAGSGGAVVLTAQAGRTVQTPAFARRGWRVEESRKGHTSFQFMPVDTGLSEDRMLYLRLQEQRMGNWLAVDPLAPNNAGWDIRGPILVVPPTYFYSSSASVISLQGLAPALTTSVAGDLPVFDPTVQAPLPIHIILPRLAATAEVTNVGSDDMLVSFGLYMPMMLIESGESTVPTGGGYAQPSVREIIICADPSAGGAVGFTLEATIGNELA